MAVEKKLFKVREKSEFYFELRKIDILKKSRVKLKYFNTVDLVPLEAERNIWGQCV